MEKEIIIIESETNNYCVYPGQCQPQNAYIYICPEDNKMYSDYDGNIGGGMSGYLWHNRELRFGIPSYMSTWAINKLMESLRSDAQKIIDGYSCEWDGSNHVGSYTDAAQDAIDRIKKLLECCDFEMGTLLIYDNFGEFLEGYTLENFLSEHTTFENIIDNIKNGLSEENEIEFDTDDIIDYICEQIKDGYLSPNRIPAWCIEESDEIKDVVESLE